MCVAGYHEDNHSSVIPSPLEISSSSAASTPCKPAIRVEIRALVPGCSSSSFTILPLCARFTPLPDETPGEFGSAVLSLCVRFTPVLHEAPEEVGTGVELGGFKLDGTTGISGGVSVSSALGIGISPDRSCSASPRARLVSRTLD